MRIAVVGSGISGLVCAHLLHTEHEICVFESNDHIGGHTHTLPVPTQDGTLHVDTGFIVFTEDNYPLFTALLRPLGVSWKPTTMSFSVRCDRTGIEYAGPFIRGILAQPGNLLRPGYWRLLRDIQRFYSAVPDLARDKRRTTSIGEYLETARSGREFEELFLIPLGASLWSCPPGKLRGFPIQFVAEFLENHGMNRIRSGPRWKVIEGGSFRYVERLVHPFRERILLRTPVHSVQRENGEIRVHHEGGSAAFDHVIMACHADQALRIVARPSAQEREILGAFPYQENETVLHTDTSVLPRARSAWASWNYRVSRGDAERAAVTYNMNILQSLRSTDTFCVTLNDRGAIEDNRIVREMVYHHPVYTRERAAAQSRQNEMIGNNGISYCGAYWGYGFHEDGVRSAERVCRAFGRGIAP